MPAKAMPRRRPPEVAAIWMFTIKTTPPIKVQSVRNLGAKIVLAGDSYDEAFARSQELAEEQGLSYIHPFDDSGMKIDGTGGAPTRVIAKVPQPIPVADPDSGAAVQMSLLVTAIMSACAIAFSRAPSVDIYA